MSKTLLPLLGLLLGSVPLAAAEAVLQRLELPGASAYDSTQVSKILRLRPGQRLRTTPERLAELLAQRYRDDGYLGVRVAGAFAPEEGVLTLKVDEARLTAVKLPSLGSSAEARALRALSLETGRPLRASDVDGALARLDQASEGVLRAGDYEVRPLDEGLQLELRPEIHRLDPAFSLRGPHTAGFYNRVDGWNLGASGSLRLGDLRRYEHTQITLAAAYGLGAETLRYAVGFNRPLAAGRVTLGYEWHDLTDRDDAYRLTGLEEGPGTSLLEGSLSDFYRRRGHEAYAFLRLRPAAQLGVSFRADRYRSLPVATDADPFGDGTPRANPPVDEGGMRSLLVTLRLTSAPALFFERSAERRSFRLRSLWGTREEVPGGLRLEATLERAGLGGDLRFTRLTSNLRQRRALAGPVRLDTRVLLGLVSEDVPGQRRLTLGGAGTLRGYPLEAFGGDALVVATVELSARAPIALPRLIALYDGGATWKGSTGDSGWKSSVGVGLRWPADGNVFARVDVARPVGEQRQGRTRWLWRLQLPL